MDNKRFTVHNGSDFIEGMQIEILTGDGVIERTTIEKIEENEIFIKETKRNKFMNFLYKYFPTFSEIYSNYRFKKFTRQLTHQKLLRKLFK